MTNKTDKPMLEELVKRVLNLKNTEAALRRNIASAQTTLAQAAQTTLAEDMHLNGNGILQSLAWTIDQQAGDRQRQIHEVQSAVQLCLDLGIFLTIPDDDMLHINIDVSEDALAYFISHVLTRGGDIATITGYRISLVRVSA